MQGTTVIEINTIHQIDQVQIVKEGYTHNVKLDSSGPVPFHNLEVSYDPDEHILTITSAAEALKSDPEEIDGILRVRLYPASVSSATKEPAETRTAPSSHVLSPPSKRGLRHAARMLTVRVRLDRARGFISSGIDQAGWAPRP